MYNLVQDRKSSTSVLHTWRKPAGIPVIIKGRGMNILGCLRCSVLVVYVSVLLIWIGYPSRIDAQTLPNQGLRVGISNWAEIKDNRYVKQPVFTAECWVKVFSSGLIVTRDQPIGEPSDWQLWYHHPRRRLAFITAKGPPDSYYFTPDNSITPGKWTHVAVVANGPAGTARVYINGTIVITPSFSPRQFDATTGLAWGGYYDNRTGAYLDGYIDECRYWNIERTQEELKRRMNERLPLDDRQGLVGYWSFCGNYADSSGYGHDLVPRGDPQIVDIPDLPVELSCYKLAPTISADSTNFGVVACGATRTKDVVIRNEGMSDLVLASIEIRGQDSGDFTMISPTSVPPQVVVAPGDSTLIRVLFNPTTVGVKFASLEVRSNAGNAPVYTITLVGIDEPFSITATPALLDFGARLPNEVPVSGYVVIRNSGRDTIRIDSVTSSLPDVFRILTSLPLTIPPGGEDTLSVEFAPVLFDEFQEVIRIFSGLCADSVAMKGIYWDGNPHLTIQAGEVSAAPGEEVSIPVYLRGTRSAQLAGVTGLTTSLRFNSTLLLPNGENKGSLAGMDRAIEFTLSIPDSDGTAYWLSCTAGLGNAVSTPLVVENTRFQGVSIPVTEIPGRFTLRVCQEGGARLINIGDTLRLFQNFPNPFNPRTTIGFSLIEPGFARLYIVDPLGRKVAILAERYFDKGKHEIFFDASNLSSGRYYYVLQSPAGTLVRSMDVLK